MSGASAAHTNFVSNVEQNVSHAVITICGRNYRFGRPCSVIPTLCGVRRSRHAWATSRLHDDSKRYASSIGSSTPSRLRRTQAAAGLSRPLYPSRRHADSPILSLADGNVRFQPGRIIATTPRPRAWRSKPASSSAASSSTRYRNLQILKSAGSDSRRRTKEIRYAHSASG
jgi:hypothetical protein